MINQGAANRRIHYAQEKNLGGSSARNQMIYHRPTVGSYQLWAEEVSDLSYEWDKMLPFYKKTMNFTPEVAGRQANVSANYTLSAHNALGGPLQVCFLGFSFILGSHGPGAYGGAGMPAATDFSSGELNGYRFFPHTVDPTTGLRSSSGVSAQVHAG